MKDKDKDKDAFLISVAGATPIKKNDKVVREIPNVKASVSSYKKIIENKTNTTYTKKPINRIFKMEKTTINKKLKKGKIPIDKKIDFHGLTLSQAEIVFFETIEECYYAGFRSLLFVTGKGVLKKTNTDEIKLYYGKIRNNFSLWIQEQKAQKYILGVEQATIEYGADGAFFVYLRKNTNS